MQPREKALPSHQRQPADANGRADARWQQHPVPQSRMQDLPQRQPRPEPRLAAAERVEAAHARDVDDHAVGAAQAFEGVFPAARAHLQPRADSALDNRGRLLGRLGIDDGDRELQPVVGDVARDAGTAGERERAIERQSAEHQRQADRHTHRSRKREGKREREREREEERQRERRGERERERGTRRGAGQLGQCAASRTATCRRARCRGGAETHALYPAGPFLRVTALTAAARCDMQRRNPSSTTSKLLQSFGCDAARASSSRLCDALAASWPGGSRRDRSATRYVERSTVRFGRWYSAERIMWKEWEAAWGACQAEQWKSGRVSAAGSGASTVHAKSNVSLGRG
eukprot:700422-Rhodomonas_salina.1